MKKYGRAELAPTISSMIMAAIAGGSILTILVVLGAPTYTKALQSWLGTLAVLATLAIASNQVMHSISEIKYASGIGGLGKALTKIATPFAAVVVAVAVSGQPSLWTVLGFAPFTAPAWAKLTNRWVKPHDRPNGPPSQKTPK